MKDSRQIGHILFDSRNIKFSRKTIYGVRGDRGIHKGHKESLGCDGYVHYFDWGDGFLAVYVCQNFSNCTNYTVYFIACQ